MRLSNIYYVCVAPSPLIMQWTVWSIEENDVDVDKEEKKKEVNL